MFKDFMSGAKDHFTTDTPVVLMDDILEGLTDEQRIKMVLNTISMDAKLQTLCEPVVKQWRDFNVRLGDYFISLGAQEKL